MIYCQPIHMKYNVMDNKVTNELVIITRVLIFDKNCC